MSNILNAKTTGSDFEKKFLKKQRDVISSNKEKTTGCDFEKIQQKTTGCDLENVPQSKQRDVISSIFNKKTTGCDFE